MFADRDRPVICPFRSILSYISDVQRIDGDFIAGWLLPVVTVEGGRGHLSLYAVRMTANLGSDLGMAELPNHFTM